MRVACLLLAAMPLVWSGEDDNGAKLALNVDSKDNFTLYTGTGKAKRKEHLNASKVRALTTLHQKMGGRLPAKLRAILPLSGGALSSAVHPDAPKVRHACCAAARSPANAKPVVGTNKDLPDVGVEPRAQRRSY